MGEEGKSWLPQPQFNWLSPMVNAFGNTLEAGQSNTVSPHMNSYANMIPTEGASLLGAYSGPLPLQAGQANEFRGWFYYQPSYQEAFAPTPNYSTMKRPPARPHEDLKCTIEPDAGIKSAQKRFLVFDKSGDQTAVFISSSIRNPIHTLASWSTKPTNPDDLCGQHVATNAPMHPSGPVLTDKFNENCEAVAESELHEDTEGLNALLYSADDSSDTEDDEVMSTGHSPGTMTARDDLEWFEGIPDEVASFDGATKTKRQKLSVGGYDEESLMDTASSVKPNGSRKSSADDAADSSCADSLNPKLGAMGSLSGKKRRIRKEKIHETVSILQSIIPGVKGKNTVGVLDEAIRYLRSLKLKAKAMGLESF